MSKREFFNPLDNLNTGSVPQQSTASAKPGELMATAAIYNETVGVCPKCKGRMTSGLLPNSDSVYFCTVCRVSTPMQD